MSSPWDPDLYARFKAERELPFYDLLGTLVQHPHMRVVDLGCGTGELTRVLHRHLHARSTVGVDSSTSMLARSAELVEPGLTFEAGSIDEFRRDGDLDLVFSNAALHWVADHPRLLERLAGGLVEGGQLAVQIPANQDQPIHTQAAALADEEPFASALGAWRHRASVLAPEEYARQLDRIGFRKQRVALRVYGHHLPDRESVLDWVGGALLTVYRARLSDELYGEFVARYRERLFDHYADARPFFFPFKRILFWGSL